MKHLLGALLILSFLSTTSCSSAQPKATPPETPEVTKTGSRGPIALPAPLPPREPVDPAISSAAPGARHFRRSELDRVLTKGPGSLLQYVRVAPSYKARRFLGFKLEQVLSADPRFKAPNVSAGDVILKINKVRIQTPDDFHKAFHTLKGATEVEFDILRGNNRFLVIYPILNDITIQPENLN